MSDTTKKRLKFAGKLLFVCLLLGILYYSFRDSMGDMLTELAGVNAQAETVLLTCREGTVQVTVGIPGDINGDGRVTSADLLRLRRYLAGQSVPVETGNADLNADGKVDLTDVMLLQKLLIGGQTE